MSDDLEPTLQVFRMATVAGVVSSRLPVSRARTVHAVAVRPDGPVDGGPAGQPLRVVDAAAAVDDEPLMTFPWAGGFDDLVAGRRRWDGVPPVPLPDAGWHDLDQAWWAWLVVHDGWVFGAQTEYDAAMDALAARAPLTWTGSGQGLLGAVPLTWFRVPRPAWDAAWQLAVEQVHATGS
jgi:hypothetical protein